MDQGNHGVEARHDHGLRYCKAFGQGQNIGHVLICNRVGLHISPGLVPDNGLLGMHM